MQEEIVTSVLEEIALGFGKTDRYKETTGIPALSSFESELALPGGSLK
jgi:hypothetical protein